MLGNRFHAPGKSPSFDYFQRRRTEDSLAEPDTTSPIEPIPPPSHLEQAISLVNTITTLPNHPQSILVNLLHLAHNNHHRQFRITRDIADIFERQDLILKLGKLLVTTGAPIHRIEGAMELTGKRLDITGSYIVLPGIMIISFSDLATHTSDTHLIRCSRSLDMSKLAEVNLIAYQLDKGTLDLTEASNRLDCIAHAPPTWNPWITLIGYTLSSAFAAPLFFDGSWTDCWISGVFGLCVGILTWVSERIPMLSNVVEIIITILVAAIALTLRNYTCYSAVALSAIVLLLPGYILTGAVMELAARKLCSGAVHLVHALMYVLFLAFGMGYGSDVWALAHPDLPATAASMHHCHLPIDPYWYFLCLPLTCLGICLCFGASLKHQFPVFTLNAAVGFAVMYFMTRATGPSSFVTPSVGAFALGLTGNLYARITHRAAFVPLFGGIVILVPGSIGVRGAVTLFQVGNEHENGLFTFQMIGIALSITLGLFLANACIYPTGRKSTVFLGF